MDNKFLGTANVKEEEENKKDAEIERLQKENEALLVVLAKYSGIIMGLELEIARKSDGNREH